MNETFNRTYKALIEMFGNSIPDHEVRAYVKIALPNHGSIHHRELAKNQGWTRSSWKNRF